MTIPSLVACLLAACGGGTEIESSEALGPTAAGVTTGQFATAGSLAQVSGQERLSYTADGALTSSGLEDQSSATSEISKGAAGTGLALPTIEPTPKKHITAVASAAPTTKVETIRLSSPTLSSLGSPDLIGLDPFVAKPPYFVQTKDGAKRVKLGIYGTNDDIARIFDFVAPFINPQTQRTNALTFQMPVLTANGMRFLNISDASTPVASNSIPGERISYQSGELFVGYRANDPASGEKCRVMVNSWPIPTRTVLTWDLSFKLGGTQLGEDWPVTKPTTSPTLLWQLKADPGFPSMGFFVDTSSEDQSKIQLTFFQRLANESLNNFRWVVPDIEKSQPIKVIVQAQLDDRDDAFNQGFLRVWVNGRLIAERHGRNLIQGMAEPHRWAFGTYLMSESVPVDQNRITIWQRARMLVAP